MDRDRDAWLGRDGWDAEMLRMEQEWQDGVARRAYTERWHFGSGYRSPAQQHAMWQRWRRAYYGADPALPPAREPLAPAAPSEEDVRRIVREEIGKLPIKYEIPDAPAE